MPEKKFNPMHVRFRATFAGNQLGAVRLGKIDTENEVLHDVQITLEGEALGHGVWLDRQFCEDCAKAGNATGDVGLKVRYGHPSMCSDAIGTELGRAKNFRVVDVNRKIDGKDVKCAGVVADVQLLKSAHSAPQGDIAKHVIETAKEDPKQFGQSIVFTYSDWKVKDADGKDHSYYEEVEKPYAEWRESEVGKSASGEACWKKYKGLKSAWKEKSADGKTYAVLGKLHGSDFTDTPAATDGIFSTGTLAEEAETMLEEHPQILEMLDKSPKSVAEFLERTGLGEKLAAIIAKPSAQASSGEGLQPDAEGNWEARFKGLSKRFNDLQSEHMAAIAAVEADYKAKLDAMTAERDDFKNQLDQSAKDLADAQAKVSKLSAKAEEDAKALQKATDDLAQTRDSLKAAEDKAKHLEDTRDALTAGVLTPPAAGTSYADKMKAAKTPEEREALRAQKRAGKIK